MSALVLIILLDIKQVVIILNNIAVKWAVDSLQGGKNESRLGENESWVGKIKAGWYHALV